MTDTQSASYSWPRAGMLGRLSVLGYALVAYGVGAASIAWLVACLSGLGSFAPGPIHARSLPGAIVIDLTLLVLFALQHSLMARQGFKERWLRVIPPAAERSTYVLAAGLTLGLLVWLWQPMGQTVWSVSAPASRAALWGLFAFGWTYLLLATYATDHFDLFGLRQAWLYAQGRDYTPVPFVRRWMYRYSRHPMMAGILIGIWATPEMHLDHLLLAAGFSVYIAIGIALEERDLVRNFGDGYRRYRDEVGRFLSRPGR